MVERLLDAIELRLRPVEDKKASLESVEKLIRDVGLQRINDVLTPAIQSVLLIQERGFLMARSSTPAALAANDVHTFVIADEHERATFVPGPYPALTRDGSPDDTAVTRLIAWEPTTGELMVEIIAVFGDPGPHDDWVIVATAGVANAMQAMLAEMRALAGQVAGDRLAVADDRTAAQTARGEAVIARNQAAGFAEAAHDSAVAAASFDPSSYYPKTETYSKGEVDLALGEKLEADDLTAAATSFDKTGTGLAADDVQAALVELDSGKAATAALGLHFRNMEVFTTSGTFTPPEGVTRVFVRLINGGSGGPSNAPIGSGAGGTYSEIYVDVLGPVIVSIGAGGAGGVYQGASAQPGGVSSFGSVSSSNAAAAGGVLFSGTALRGAANSGFGNGNYGQGGTGGGSGNNGTAGTAGLVIVMW
ncbi:MAG: hypothetical protein M9905_17465 [Rhizobiaceae bacterium]|nr:hypothetical protein [Rhizobiaceae bacterium]